jgi:5S rRNA maturation endonuclease (ribonuclease M5)
MLEYLHNRGLYDEVLQANHVGADPGPRHLPRAHGLPARGPAVIFPIHDDHGPIYLQARYLNPGQAGGRKYENPATWVATNPRYTSVAIEGGSPRADRVFICEGLPDALSIAQAGSQAIALLGVGLADQQLAQYIHDHYRGVPAVIAFDSDPRGRASTRTLAHELRRTGHVAVHELEFPVGVKDLNHWASLEPGIFDGHIASRTTSLAAGQNACLAPNESPAPSRFC